MKNLFTQKGFTLIELLVAVLLLAMITTMVYSILNVGIRAQDKGGKKLLAMERQLGLLNLLHHQVNSAWYDVMKDEITISSDGNYLRIITRYPLINRSSGIVLAMYRYDEGEQTLYYLEKKDYYNIDYDDEYLPAIDEMYFLTKTDGSFFMEYDSEEGNLLVEYLENQYVLLPRCGFNPYVINK